MYTENKTPIKESNDKSTQASTWNEYSSFHDSFIELLSYGRKHNLSANNVWTFCYV